MASAHRRRVSKPKVQNQRDRTSLSARIHSLRKLLKHPNAKIPADVRIEKERELAGYVLDQERAQSERARRKQTKKYHFVRFMERKKAEKNLKRLLKEQDDEHAGEAADDLESQIRTAKVDLAYSIYAPLAEKYEGIFAEEHSRKNDDTSQHDKEAQPGVSSGTATKPRMWHEVEKLLGNEDALERLRNRVAEKTRANSTKSKGRQPVEEGALLDEDGEDDFFEK